jgi:hypothetical protein
MEKIDPDAVVHGQTGVFRPVCAFLLSSLYLLQFRFASPTPFSRPSFLSFPGWFYQAYSGLNQCGLSNPRLPKISPSTDHPQVTHASLQLVSISGPSSCPLPPMHRQSIASFLLRDEGSICVVQRRGASSRLPASSPIVDCSLPSPDRDYRHLHRLGSPSGVARTAPIGYRREEQFRIFSCEVGKGWHKLLGSTKDASEDAEIKRGGKHTQLIFRTTRGPRCYNIEAFDVYPFNLLVHNVGNVVMGWGICARKHNK